MTGEKNGSGEDAAGESAIDDEAALGVVEDSFQRVAECGFAKRFVPIFDDVKEAAPAMAATHIQRANE